MKAQPFKLTDYRQQPASILSNEPTPQKTGDYLIPVFLFFTAAILLAATLYSIHQNNRITATIKGLKKDVETLSNSKKTEENVQATTRES